jgi:RimJ/RimL family protein N-acetyltransferase
VLQNKVQNIHAARTQAFVYPVQRIQQHAARYPHAEGGCTDNMRLSYMNISALSQQDLSAYRQLRLESILDSPSSFVPTHDEESQLPDAQMAARLNVSPYQATFGAFQHDALVGTVGFVRDSRSKIYHRANIVGVYVTPAARGNGIAQALFEAVIAYARQFPEVVQLDLKVNTINIGARALYAKLGFDSCGIDYRAMCIDGQFHDEERMALRLTAR